MGRNKVSDELKEKRGTLQKCRKNNSVNISSIEKISDISGNLGIRSKRAKDIFIEKANQLIYLNLLTEMDIEQLAIYANNIDMIFTCLEEIEKGKFQEQHDENGNIVRFVENPYLKLYKELVPIVNRMSKSFGFDPEARSRNNIKSEEKKPSIAELLKD